MHHFYHQSAPLLDLSFVGHSISLTLSSRLVVIVAVIVALYFLIRYLNDRSFGSDFEIDKADIGIGSGTISFKPNRGDQQIAYAIWVELSTRKIGIPIDLKHDVVYEIYDSWHNFFSITRELIKDIPVNKVKSKSTQEIINLSIEVLNQGLRPHLTSWQARFRHWYEKQLAEAKGDAEPQSIQEQYPKFDELKTDLLAVNARLIKYREKMRELVFGFER